MPIWSTQYSKILLEWIYNPIVNIYNFNIYIHIRVLNFKINKFLIIYKRPQDSYDPDEQAILRLMHENMREWDQVNLINTEKLRTKFYEIDPYNRYILSQREVNTIFCIFIYF